MFVGELCYLQETNAENQIQIFLCRDDVFAVNTVDALFNHYKCSARIPQCHSNYTTGTSFVCLLKKKVPVVYISILYVNSENTCLPMYVKFFVFIIKEIYNVYMNYHFCFILHKNSEFRMGLYIKHSSRYIYHYR